MAPQIPTQAGSTVELTLNCKTVVVRRGITVAAALMQAGIATRNSVSGEPRNPLCAMGVCMECCATVNGVPHVRTCQIVIEPGMILVTE